jgi:hypothetical protein
MGREVAGSSPATASKRANVTRHVPVCVSDLARQGGRSDVTELHRYVGAVCFEQDVLVKVGSKERRHFVRQRAHNRRIGMLVRFFVATDGHVRS